jgi:hypothetical protein
VCCLLFVLQCLGGYRIASHRIASHRIHNLASMHKLPSTPSCTKLLTRTIPHVSKSPSPSTSTSPSKYQRRARRSPSRKLHRACLVDVVVSRLLVLGLEYGQHGQHRQCSATPCPCAAVCSRPPPVDCDIIQYTIRQVQSACVASEQTRTHALTPFRGVALVAGATDG